MISSIRVKYFLLKEILIFKYISRTRTTIELDIVSYMRFVVRDTEIINILKFSIYYIHWLEFFTR